MQKGTFIPLCSCTTGSFKSSLAGSLTVMRGPGCILFIPCLGIGLPAPWVSLPLSAWLQSVWTPSLVLTHSQGWRERGQDLQLPPLLSAKCSRAGSSALGQSFIPWGQWIITALRTRQGQLLNSYSDAVRIFHNKSLTGKKNQTNQQTKPHNSQPLFLPLDANHSP